MLLNQRACDDAARARRPLLRRTLLAAFAAPVVARAQGSSHGGFPQRPITLINPSVTGGSFDGALRALAVAASRRLGQPVVVESRPGASQTLGPLAVARGRTDGYLLSALPVSAIRVAMLQGMAFDALRDFAPIVHAAAFTFGAAARKGRFPEGWASAVAEARRRPGEITVGSPGINTTLQLGMVELCAREGIAVNHIPFRGDAEGMTALIGGHVDMVAGSTTLGGPVDDGVLEWLHLWTPQRVPRWPNTPTLLELGYADMGAYTSPYGIVAHARTDPEALAVLRRAFLPAAGDEEHLAALRRYDMLPEIRDAAAYEAFLRTRVAQEAELVRRIQATPAPDTDPTRAR